MSPEAGGQRLRPAVLKASSGYIAGHALALLSVFVLAKFFFDPDDFGVQAQALAVATVAATIGSLRLDQAVSAVREDRAAAAACVAAATSAILLGVPLSVGVSLLVLPSSIDGLSIGLAAAWIPALVLHSSLTALAQRRNAFGLAAWGRIAASVTAASVAISLGALGHVDGSSLLMGTLAGSCAGGLLLLLFAAGRPGTAAMHPSAWIRWSHEFRAFALYSTPVQALADLLAQLPVIVLGRAFGTDFSGYLGMAQRIGLSPPTMLGQVMRQVVFPTAARSFHAGRMPVAMLLRVGGATGLGGVAWMLLVVGVLAADDGAVLGPEWAEAGHVVTILAVPFLLQTINIPLSVAWPVAGRQRRELGVTIVRAVLVAGVLAGATLASDRSVALVVYASGASVAWLVAIGAVLALLRSTAPKEIQR